MFVFQRSYNDLVNILVINAPLTPKLGLLNGKIGMAIFFYQYAEEIKADVFEEFAGELIDEIFDDIHMDMPVGFSSGLLGIGWGLAYLLQHKFVDGDIDEILIDLDTAVFQLDRKRPVLKRDYGECYGYGLYYLMRTSGINKNWNQDVFVQILSDVNDIVTSTIEVNRKPSGNYLVSLLYFVDELQQKGLLPLRFSDLPYHTSLFVRKSLDHMEINVVEAHMLLDILNRMNRSVFVAHLSDKLNKYISQFQIGILNDQEILSLLSQASWYKMVFNYIPNDLEKEILPYVKKIFGNRKTEEQLLNNMHIDNLGFDNGWCGWTYGLLMCDKTVLHDDRFYS